MPITTKYKSVAVPIETHTKLSQLSENMIDGAKLSISKVIEVLTTKEVKKLNGKLSRQ